MGAFEFRCGLRYLMSKKKHVMIRLTTFISIGGIATGVMTLIVVLSVMNGFGQDLRDKILSFKSHILIESQDFSPIPLNPSVISAIQKQDSRIQSIEPYILTEMMIRFDGQVAGVLFKGIQSKEDLMKPGVYLGQELAQTLGASEGDHVEIISPLETTGPMGAIPKLKRFKIEGILKTGVYETDTKLVQISLSEAQKFLDYGNGIHGYEMKVSNIFKTSDIIKKIKQIPELTPLLIRDWIDLNKSLLGALKLEKMAMFFILTFIILVAALNIVMTLTRNVLEKRKEISILKAMGASQGQIFRIFFVQGFLIGLVGIAIGLAGGYGICVFLNRSQLIHLPDIYYSTVVPVAMEHSYFIGVTLIAILIIWLSSLLPASRAAKLNPLEGIRYS